MSHESQESASDDILFMIKLSTLDAMNVTSPPYIVTANRYLHKTSYRAYLSLIKFPFLFTLKKLHVEVTRQRFIYI